MTAPTNDCGLLYHLVQGGLWSDAKASGGPYTPPTYADDGFVHLTKDPGMLLDVANHFYKDIPGPWLLLELDSTRLSHKVVFEPAAPVGSTPAHSSEPEVLFPHLYGPIDAAAVTRELDVKRADDGTFLAIHGLPQAAGA